MLNFIEVKNFKCFENLNLELSNLNILAGINSMGKSTMIQALLLLRQTYEMGTIEKGIHINGPIVTIGTGYDLFYRNSEDDEFKISIGDNDTTYLWKYEYDKDSDFQKLKDTNIYSEEYKKINLFKQEFSYVSAERIGPKRIYPKSYHEVIDNNRVGYNGELVADYIAERGLKDKISNSNVIHSEAKSQYILYQIQAWLSEISPGIKIDTSSYDQAGVVGVDYGVEDNSVINKFNPLNVGFGLSYLIPIVVTLLKAKKGDLVIIENPEAHIHPKGQRKMGELIAKACAGGVQVILETHSDHILNGIRLAVKYNDIDRKLIRLNYFYQEVCNKKIIHKKCSPIILDDGSLSDWPDGFFDEWEKAIDDLL